jgi:hypothetical protein
MNALATAPHRHRGLDLKTRVRSEFVEMPGLRLTTAQAQRLWNLSPEECEAILSALIEEKTLKRTHDGAFVRA